MTRHLCAAPMFSATLAAVLALPLTACDKKGDADNNETETPGEDGGKDEGPVEPDVPQEPDPPEIASARLAYLLGNYAEVAAALAPIYEDLVGRSQYRAGGLAGGWLALALARDVVENGEAPAKHAAAMGDRTRDAEVICVGNIALGAIALGLEDFDGAVTALQKAVAAADAPPADHALAQLMLAEAFIGRAYGAGGGTNLEHPEDLDAAKKSYQEAMTPASGVAESDMLLGRIHEGLAAIGKYQGKNDELCSNVKLAAEKYEAAGVSEHLKEGPELLAAAARCPK